MFRKKRFSIIAIILLILIYTAFTFVNKGMDGNFSPKITFDSEETLTVSVKDGEEMLMEGVHATDKEDGDLTDKVIIDSLSAFNSNNERMVTYIVFDSKNKYTQATRMIKYSDYTAPKFKFSEPLIQGSLSLTRINRIVGAKSSVDGDISNNVSIKTNVVDNTNMELKLSVTDSTGTESNLKVLYEYDNTKYRAQIKLDKNIIYLKKGESYDFLGNVESVMMGSNVQEMMMERIIVDSSNVDINTPGVYNVYYGLDQTDSNVDARTKAIVVVQ